MYYQTQKEQSRYRLLPIIVLLLVAGIIGLGWWQLSKRMGQSDDKKKTSGFTKHDHSLTSPTSIWVITNKKRPLHPKTYAPSDLMVPRVPLRLDKASDEMHLRAPAARALENLVQSARKDGLSLMLASGYRSYSSQKKLYDYYVSQQGKVAADTQSARPGYSEHQTGLAADLEPASKTCEIQSCFADSPEGEWIAAHAYKYGFILRYTKDNQATTGYIYEPWHIRYVGPELAKQLQKAGMPTLEDFFGLGRAGTY